MYCFLKMAEIFLKRKWMMEIQVNTYNGFAQELGAHFRALKGRWPVTPALRTSSFHRGRSPYSEPRTFLSASSAHRGCDVVLGWVAWAPCPVACSCGSMRTAREENLNPMGLALL